MLGFFRGVSILDGSFLGVGAFSMVGHSGVQSDMVVLKKYGGVVSYWQLMGGSGEGG